MVDRDRWGSTPDPQRDRAGGKIMRSKVVAGPSKPAQGAGLGEEAKAWLAERSLSVTVAEELRVFQAERYFSKLGKKTQAIAFPYIEEGRVVFTKYRSLEGKDFSADGHPPPLYRPILSDRGEWDFDLGGSNLLIVEGEFDLLAALTAGWDGDVASVSSGVGTDLSKVDFGRNEITLALDGDETGRRSMASILSGVLAGKVSTKVVEYPEGCKDLNEVLINLGAEGVLAAIHNAKPLPIQGVYQSIDYENRLEILRNGGNGRGYSTGIADLDQIYSIPMGYFTIITGWANDGKSTFLDNVIYNLARNEGLRSVLWSPENEPDIHIAKLLELHSDRPFFAGENDRMSDHQIAQSMGFLNEHFYWVTGNEEGEGSVDETLKIMEACIKRYNCSLCVFDPYNHIPRNTNSENETEWVRVLTLKLRRFARRHGVHVFLVAHPRQAPAGVTRFPPTGLHCAGSAHFQNVADFGLTVYRPEGAHHTEIITWKVRHRWHGSRGTISLDYDPFVGRYRSFGDTEF